MCQLQGAAAHCIGGSFALEGLQRLVSPKQLTWSWDLLSQLSWGSLDKYKVSNPQAFFFFCSTEFDLVYILTELFSIKWDADCTALVARSCLLLSTLWGVHANSMLIFSLYRSPRPISPRFTESHILHWNLRTIFIFYHCCPVFSPFFGGGRYLKPWVCM